MLLCELIKELQEIDNNLGNPIGLDAPFCITFDEHTQGWDNLKVEFSDGKVKFMDLKLRPESDS